MINTKRKIPAELHEKFVTTVSGLQLKVCRGDNYQHANWRCFTSQLGAGGPVGSCNEYVLIVTACLTFEKSDDASHS